MMYTWSRDQETSKVQVRDSYLPRLPDYPPVLRQGILRAGEGSRRPPTGEEVSLSWKPAPTDVPVLCHGCSLGVGRGGHLAPWGLSSARRETSHTPF